MNLRKQNSENNQSEFAQSQIVLSSRPRMIFIELTRACNLACPMCRPEILAGPQYRMSDTLLDRVREELFPFVEAVDLRGSGESTLDDRLVPVARELSGHGVRIHLYTNMVSRGTTYWRELGGLPLNLTISIDAASSATLKKLRGAARDKLLTNLAAFQEGRMSSGYENCALHFSAVVSDANLDELPDLVRLASDFGVPVVKLNPLTEPDPSQGGYPRIGVSTCWRSQLQANLKDAAALAQSSGVRLELGASLDNAGNGGFEQCLHPWSYCVVHYDGSVVYCDHFVGNNNAAVGNLNTLPFMEIWNGSTYQAIRQNHVTRTFDWAKRRGLECDWCYHNRYADFEGSLDPSFQPLVLTGAARQVSQAQPSALPEG